MPDSAKRRPDPDGRARGEQGADHDGAGLDLRVLGEMCRSPYRDPESEAHGDRQREQVGRRNPRPAS